MGSFAAAFEGRPLLGPRLVACALAAAGAFAATAADAQQADRERQQLRQMQQQVQHLQSENSSLQNSLTQAQAKSAKEIDQARKEGRSALGQVARLKQEAKARGEELDELHSNLSATTDRLNAANGEIERLRGSIAERDEALRKAAEQKRRDDAAATLLQDRLKAQTGRADLCETRHVGLTDFSGKLISRYEADRLRLCEPVTGIWKVRNEKEVQALREQLYEFRLDIPADEMHKP